MSVGIMPDASAASLHPFVTDHIEPGATVITDRWQGYGGNEGLGYVREIEGPTRRPLAQVPNGSTSQ